MAIKTIYQNPSIADQVIIPILTLGADNCFSADPYAINKVTIYYLGIDFTTGGATSLTDNIPDPVLEAELVAAQQVVCQNPSPDNIIALQTAQAAVNGSGQTTTTYYSQATPVTIIGTPVFPAWLSTDQSNAFLIHNTKDANGNTLYGNFQYDWLPFESGVREGNYVVCWTWTPFAAGSTLSASVRFALSGDTAVTTAIPTHQTMPGKYRTLLDRYTPEMYKLSLGTGDLTPYVITNFNLALAKGFTTLENLANQIIDLLDANATATAILPLLSDFFNLKLKSSDPTLWRRQIKTAVPYFKAKGTLAALSEALDAAGIKLAKLTKLWQVISRHTWIDDFLIETPPQTEFILSRPALPIDPLNFGLSLRRNGTPNYVELDSSYVSFTDNQGYTVMNWLGNANLNPGDRLQVLYEYRPITNYFEQQIENYIRTLPLADQRDETLQDFPLKNWNVRVIEEDDPLIDLVIPTRYPFINHLIFGKVRTEFPYSENVYDSEEYNGGKYDSINPCDIDKDFLDPCTLCQGSKFTVDLEIEQLSNERITEAQEVITEYSPFHAVLHSINLAGGQSDYIQAPVEAIEQLVQYAGTEIVLGGMGQMVFNRARFYGLTLDVIARNMLANATTVVPSDTGTGTNAAILLYGQNVIFNDIGLNPAESVLEIMAPSPHAGQYTVDSPNLHTVQVNGIVEPLNTSPFTFRLSNNYYQNSTTTIFQDNIFGFQDANVNFTTQGIQTQWDVDNNDYAGNIWSIKIPVYSATPYPILNILSDGNLLLDGSGGGLPSMNISSVNYMLLDGNGNTIVNSVTGSLTVQNQGRVLIADPNYTTIQGYLLIGYYLVYAGQQYEITGYVTNQPMEFYIAGYTGGNVGGVSINVYQRLLNNEIGTLGYTGLILTTTPNYEVVLDIQNGDNPPAHVLDNNSFIENFLVQIGSNYYAISEINGRVITLAGPPLTWTLAGTPVAFSIIRYIKVSATVSNSVTSPVDDPVNNLTFTQIDRSGYEFITNNLNTPIFGNAFWMTMLNMPEEAKDNKIEEMVQQKEGISFRIEYKDGNMEEHDLR